MDLQKIISWISLTLFTLAHDSHCVKLRMLPRRNALGLLGCRCTARQEIYLVSSHLDAGHGYIWTLKDARKENIWYMRLRPSILDSSLMPAVTCCLSQKRIALWHPTRWSLMNIYLHSESRKWLNRQFNRHIVSKPWPINCEMSPLQLIANGKLHKGPFWFNKWRYGDAN